MRPVAPSGLPAISPTLTVGEKPKPRCGSEKPWIEAEAGETRYGASRKEEGAVFGIPLRCVPACGRMLLLARDSEIGQSVSSAGVRSRSPRPPRRYRLRWRQMLAMLLIESRGRYHLFPDMRVSTRPTGDPNTGVDSFS